MKETKLKLLPLCQKLFLLFTILSFLTPNLTAQDILIPANSVLVWNFQGAVPNNGIIDNLIIQQGAKLSIGENVTIRIKDNNLTGGRVVIESGGELELSGTLTAHFTSWEGIWVHGWVGPQHPDTHGTIRVLGGTIEKSNWGIDTEMPPYGNIRGGIVEAVGATFRNNRRAVRIRPYENHPIGTPWPYNGPEIDYLASLVRCTFIIDDNYSFGFNEQDDQLSPFVVMEDVRGVQISGCSFIDRRSILGPNRPSGKVGIWSFYAAPRITGSGNTQNTFYQLGYGARIFGEYTGGISPIISDSDFNCWHGIYMISTGNTTITDNNFNIQRANLFTLEILPYGVYLDHCDGYDVSVNEFTSNSNVLNYIGLAVRNQHPNNTEVFNNRFTNVLIPTMAADQNTDGNGGAGLEYRCNNFTGGLVDVNVAGQFDPEPPTIFDPPPTSIIGIPWQILPANRFSENPNAWVNINNNTTGADGILYIHYDDSTESRLSPDNNTGPVWVIESFDMEPDGHCPNFQRTAEQDIEAFRNTKETKDVLFVETLNTLNELVDNGNTSQLVNQVRYANNGSIASDVYHRIMQQAPFTSDAVLEEVSLNETGFTKAMVRNVLRQHPQAAKSVRIQNNLDNRINPLPQFMRNQINQGLNVISEKEQMEFDAARHRRARDRAINKAVQTLAADNTDRSDEIIDFLSYTNNLGFQYRVAAIYDDRGETQQAKAILDDISNWELTEKELQDHQAYVGLRSVLQSWDAAGKNLIELSQSDMNVLHDYATQNNTAAGKAIAILKANGNQDYPEPIYLPENLVEERRIVDISSDETTDNNVLIYPNPANDYFTVNYNLSEYKEAFLQITDITGRTMYQEQLNYEQDGLVFLTTDYPTGQYVCTIYADGKVIGSQKFTVTK